MRAIDTNTPATGAIADGSPHCFVNGEALALDVPASIAVLLARKGLQDKRVAVECNGRIVPRSMHARYFVNAGDRIEIVIAVGGG